MPIRQLGLACISNKILILALGLCFVSGSVCAFGDSSERGLRVRVTWGGGAPRKWSGKFSAQPGQLSDFRPLGLDADEARSLVVSKDAVVIQTSRPCSFEGFEVFVKTSADANLHIKLQAADDEYGGRTLQFPLYDLINATEDVSLDSLGNRLLIRRSPGDDIRVVSERDSMVFATSEIWTLDVVPYRAGFGRGNLVRFEARVRENGSGETLWKTQRTSEVDSGGRLPEVEHLEIPIPDVEGVYDVVFTLSRKGFRGAFGLRGRSVQRKIQFVAIAPRTPLDDDADQIWQTHIEFDPSHPRWWERIRWPHLKLVPGVRARPINNKRSRVVHSGQTGLMELEPEGWQAFPIPVVRPGQPHILEIEYVDDVAQTVGVSILEPDSAGEVGPVGLDTGFEVKSSTPNSTNQMSKHRVFFWPRGKSPYILITNRHDSLPARFGRIRVLTGPSQLSPSAFDFPDRNGRMPLAHFDRPLFPELFGGPTAIDPNSGQTFDDWLTFYQAGRRLTEYLKYAGYAGVSIAAYCEGSTIYPSRVLAPTPKYDTGIYATTGQDPMRKDVLEMLLRMFDREGLVLVPSVQFTSPIPRLEAEAIHGEESLGLRLVDRNGRTWTSESLTDHGNGAHYNPLDERVQSAMLDVVAELSERYGHHQAFGGLSVDLAPDGYATLPGNPWGHDRRTVATFRKETTDVAPVDEAENAEITLPDGDQEPWLSWRAAKLHELHQSFYSRLKQSRPDATLFLCSADLLDAPAVRTKMQPALPRGQSDADALLNLGFQPGLYLEEPGIVLLRPNRLIPSRALTDQGVHIEFNESEEMDQLFGGKNTGSQFYHETEALRLRSFDEVSPFGREKTFTWLAPRFSPAGPFNRRRFIRSLATLDTTFVFDGGWTVAMGQEDSLSELLETYRRLPRKRFQVSSESQPVIVRTLTDDGRTFVYVINDSPWPVEADILWDVPSSCRLLPLTRRQTPPLQPDMPHARWTVSLDPYDLVGGTLSTPGASVTSCSVRLPDGTIELLQGRVAEIAARAAQLNAPRPIEVLGNPGYEQVSEGQEIPGWTVMSGIESVQADSQQAHTGRRSLRVSGSKMETKIRSEPFAIPRSKRLTLQVWLRCENEKEVPTLRLNVVGDTETIPATIGSLKGARGLSAEWKQFIYHVPLLPDSLSKTLRIGFDLVGPGTVWIDDVELYDLWFDPNERDVLRRIIANSDAQLRQGRLSDCLRELDRFWPRFLMEYVPAPEPRIARAPSRSSRGKPSKDPPRRSMFDNVKRLVPWVPF